MNVHLINQKATPQQMREMLQSLESYIKLAVDIERKVIVGGGILHADCESLLLEDGSEQENIWGADWLPSTQQVTYESLINIRPRQKNFALEIENPKLKQLIKKIVIKLSGGVAHE